LYRNYQRRGKRKSGERKKERGRRRRRKKQKVSSLLFLPCFLLYLLFSVQATILH